MPMQRKHKIKS